RLSVALPRDEGGRAGGSAGEGIGLVGGGGVGGDCAHSKNLQTLLLLKKADVPCDLAPHILLGWRGRLDLVQEVAGEVAVVGKRTAPAEPGVQLVEVADALLAVLPAEIYGAAMQLAAEVDQPVGGPHFDAQLRHS